MNEKDIEKEIAEFAESLFAGETLEVACGVCSSGGVYCPEYLYPETAWWWLDSFDLDQRVLCTDDGEFRQKIYDEYRLMAYSFFPYAIELRRQDDMVVFELSSPPWVSKTIEAWGSIQNYGGVISLGRFAEIVETETLGMDNKNLSDIHCELLCRLVETVKSDERYQFSLVREGDHVVIQYEKFQKKVLWK